MTAARTLDRKSRLAVAAVVAVLLVVILVMARALIVAVTPVSVVAESDAGDNQLVVIGGQTQFFAPGTVGGKVAQWLNSGVAQTAAFTIEEQNFSPDADQLSVAGQHRLARLTGLMQSNPDLKASVYVMAYGGADAAHGQQLANARAQRIRSEMLAAGISPSRIKAAGTRSLTTSRGGKPPTMVVVLAK